MNGISVANLCEYKGEKLCTIRDEGDVEVYDSNDTEERKDYQVEFEMARMTHIGVPVFNKFGFIKITD